MDYGEWTENSRGTYNKWDGVSRCTTQVPKAKLDMLYDSLVNLYY